jgi:isopenicillin N synthase-like dioxygenase
MNHPQAIDVRGEMQDDAAALYLMDHPDSDEEIPTLDMGPYLQGTPGALEHAAAQLREISQTIGFFYLKGHGIPQRVIDQVFEASRRFHALPAAQKDPLPSIDVGTLKSGYQPASRETRAHENVNIISGAKPNSYSRLTFNLEGGSGGANVPAPGAVVNVWPDNLPGFKEAVLDYHLRMKSLACQFLPLWAAGLKLPLDYFDPYFRTPHLSLALSHYPPQKEVGQKQYGIAPHTDNSMMTFLAQANVPGLAVRMPSGHWRLVDIVPDTLLVNTGNTLVRWTNNEYLSTRHRVINTNDVDRYSIPVFFGPAGDALIDCVPTCRGPERPALYEPSTYEALRRWYYA